MKMPLLPPGPGLHAAKPTMAKCNQAYCKRVQPSGPELPHRWWPITARSAVKGSHENSHVLALTSGDRRYRVFRYRHVRRQHGKRPPAPAAKGIVLRFADQDSCKTHLIKFTIEAVQRLPWQVTRLNSQSRQMNRAGPEPRRQSHRPAGGIDTARDHEINVAIKAENHPTVPAPPLTFATEQQIQQAIGCKPGSIGPVRG